MKYRYLNEVLLNWNSSKNIQDNNIIKSSDIKKEMEQCFIYKVDNEPSKIKIFDDGSNYGWTEFKKFKNKVYINNKHIKLDNEGWTIDIFDPREYRVYIEDIDQVKNTRYMFYNCNQLVKAYIPNFITSIGDCAFQNCTSLTNMTIPDSVTSICSYAFNGCIGLTSVTIPNSVISIGRYAFHDCRSIQTVYVEDINKFKQIDFGLGESNPTCYGAKLIEI